MANISLPTGKVMYMSIYQYLFLLEDDDMDIFYQSCIADDLGTYIENPFSQRKPSRELDIDDDEHEEEDITE